MYDGGAKLFNEPNSKISLFKVAILRGARPLGKSSFYSTLRQTLNFAPAVMTEPQPPLSLSKDVVCER